MKPWLFHISLCVGSLFDSRVAICKLQVGSHPDLGTHLCHAVVTGLRSPSRPGRSPLVNQRNDGKSPSFLWVNQLWPMAMFIHFQWQTVSLAGGKILIFPGFFNENWGSMRGWRFRLATEMGGQQELWKS